MKVKLINLGIDSIWSTKSIDFSKPAYASALNNMDVEIRCFDVCGRIIYQYCTIEDEGIHYRKLGEIVYGLL